MEGVERKADNDDLEEAVFEWIIDMRSRNHHVSLRMIQVKAKAFSTKDDFQVSRGWHYLFHNHEKLSLWRKILCVLLIITRVGFTVHLSN